MIDKFIIDKIKNKSDFVKKKKNICVKLHNYVITQNNFWALQMLRYYLIIIKQKINKFSL